MKSLDIKHLKLLIILADTQSLTLAGKRLNLSQPALSHQLKAAEGIVGAPLFERQGKRMIANPAGSLLAKKAEQILNDLGFMLKEAKI
ncbi:MAG: LysR family transcriptional regulator [Alteromonadaceae bacterium]|nr:LysR family transcriptional regulator [Alteromonadaceae bacterium]